MPLSARWSLRRKSPPCASFACRQALARRRCPAGMDRQLAPECRRPRSRGIPCSAQQRFLALVVFVDADARGRRGRQKHLMVRHACGLGSGLHIGDVDLQFCLALIFHRGGADDRNNRQNGAAHHRFLEILGVIFGKSGDLLLENSELLTGPRLEPIEALADVSEKAWLGVFAVRYDLNAALDLLADTFSDLPRQDRTQLALIIWLPRVLCFQQIEQIVRPWQAADMRGLDMIGILLDGHWFSSEFTLENPTPFTLKCVHDARR